MAKVSNEYLPLSVLGSFPDDWQETTLAQICRQVTDGTHDSPKPVLVGGYPLITGKAIKDRRIDFAVAYNISDEEHQKVIDRSKPERDDILFANIGNSIGDLVRVQTDRSFSIKNVALFKPDVEKVYPRFLEYFFLSEQVQSFVKGSTRGSAQPFIGLSSLRGFPVALPPMDEQRNVGTILGALDDRITLLRETNATLEAIAQALFKSWFVDFDPVRAKQEGRAPDGMDEATAALFPDAFEESELGLVPRGWRVGTLASLATLNPESWTAKKHPASVAYIDLANAKDNEIAAVMEYPFDQAPSRARRALRDGDTIVGTVRPGNRSFAFIHNPATNLTASTGFAVLRPSIPRNTEFVYLSATQSSSIEHLAHVADGGAYPAVRPDVVAGIPCVLPCSAIMESFHGAIAPLLGSIAEKQLQAQTLAALRDTLLPRLISGQLRLPDAESLLEEAAA